MTSERVSVPRLPLEVYTEIALRIEEGSSFKAFIFSSKLLWRASLPIQTLQRRRLSNHLLTLIRMYRNKTWDWMAISGNRSIRLEHISSFQLILLPPGFYPIKSARWDWSAISKNPNLTWEFIQSHPEKDWDWGYLSRHPNITLEIIEGNMNKFDWNLSHLSKNPNLTLEFIQRYQRVSRHITGSWEWYFISSRPNITMEIIEANPSCPWVWFTISENPNLTWEFVAKHPDENWNWYDVSCHPNITWETIINNLYFPSYSPKAGEMVPWEWKGVSRSRNITMEIIEKNPTLPNGEITPWHYSWISENPNLTWEFVQRHLEEDWSWDRVSSHPKISMEIIFSTKANGTCTKWDDDGICLNRNLTWEVIRDHPEVGWDPVLLAQNAFGR